MEFKHYRRKQIAELADWFPGFDMTGVSVSGPDKVAGSPKLGDKIARNPANYADRWLVAADYFAINFEPAAALAQPKAAPQPSIVASAHLLTEQDTHLLAAYTPERYAGDYPEYWNLTMVRMKGDVILTVRLPTSFRQPPGATSCVRFTRELWREFNKQFAKANEVFEAADFLDAIL